MTASVDKPTEGKADSEQSVNQSSAISTDVRPSEQPGRFSGIVRTSDHSDNLAVLQTMMEGGFIEECAPVHFGSLILRRKGRSVWSVEVEWIDPENHRRRWAELEYVDVANYRRATDLYADLWRIDRMVRKLIG